MKRRTAWAVLLVLLLAGAAFLFRRAPERPVVDVPRPPSPTPAAPPAFPPTPVPPTAPAVAPVIDLLPSYLEALGRALVLRDLRRLRDLRLKRPELKEGDPARLAGFLRGELFVAAGAAELLAVARPQAAVAALAAVLAEPGRPFLKDVLIDLLAGVGGDGAVAALLATLHGEGDERVRERCARALERFPGPESYAGLVLALKDADLGVRRAAATSLGAMRSADIVRVLMAALMASPDPRFQADLFSSVDRILVGRGDPLRDLAAAARELPQAVRDELVRRRAFRVETLLERSYPLGFFATGGEPLPFDPSYGRRVGITVELGPGISMAEVAAAIFAEPPFDRYREWFYLRNEADALSESAVDALGRPLGRVPLGGLDGTVYLRFRDPAHFSKGVLGYARGCEAFVQKVSLLHEMGHALGGLGDEYPHGSPPPHANLAQDRKTPWDALVSGGHLPAPFLREPGVWVPAETCHMNNNAAGEVDFCAVCQLALMARIGELTGAPLPWR